MKIAIIGAGNVGQALGKGWIDRGHEVVFGVRDPAAAKYQELKLKVAEQLGISGLAEAVRDADVVVLATPWSATQAVIERLGDLGGKIVIDCTNPLKADLSGLTTGRTSSGAEQVAGWARGAKVCKAFNTTGFNIMQDPELEGRRAVMFVCGADDARKIALDLADQLGFEAVDAGGIESARLLEPLALLWIQLAYRHGLGGDFAFGILRR